MPVFVYSDENKTVKFTDLETASTRPDTLGKKIVVTSPQTITTAITITGRQFDCIGGGVLNCTTGSVVFGDESVDSAPIKWFGAKADNNISSAATNSAAIASAIASGAKNILFEPGTYYISENILIPNTGSSKFRILKGAGRYTTIIKPASAAVTKMVEVGQTATYDGGYVEAFEISDIELNGDSVSQYGIIGYYPHSIMKEVIVRGTTVCGIAVLGWNTIIDKCFLRNNLGDGIQTIQFGSYSIALNVINTTIAGNEGFGFNAVASGGMTNFTNCAFENNLKGAAYVWGSDYTFKTCYFERNAYLAGADVGDQGHTFTTPSVTVKTNIIANGSNIATTIGTGYPARVYLHNCRFDNMQEATSAVYAPGAETLEIKGCSCKSTLPIYLVETYGSATRNPSYGLLKNLHLDANTGWSALTNVTPITDKLIDYSPSIYNYVDSAIKKNIAVTNFASWTKIYDASASSTFAVSAVVHPLDPTVTVWEITDTDTTGSDIFGFSLDASKYTAWHGKLVMFAAYTNAVLYYRLNPPSAVLTPIDNGNQLANATIRSFVFVFPATGTLSLGARKSSATATTATIALPVLCEFGNNVEDLMNQI